MNQSIDGDTVRALPRLTSLSILNSSLSPIGDADLLADGASVATRLRHLQLADSLSSSECVISAHSICVMTNLTSLELNDNKCVTDGAFKLGGLPFLATLSLTGGCLITDVGMARLIGLTTLSLSENSSITDRGISHLTNLTRLNLSENPLITDKGLRGLSNLTWLNLHMCNRVHGRGLARMKNLRTLNLSNNKTIKDDVVIAHAKSLTKLNLENNNLITDAAVKRLTNLVTLSLMENLCISIDGISLLTTLSKLHLSSNLNITNENLRSNWKHLTCVTFDEHSAYQVDADLGWQDFEGSEDEEC